jgi:putative serine/threonine protein kinase
MGSGRSPLTQSEHADLDELKRTPYIQVLTYPKISLRDAKSRIRQLEGLGVDELIFEGRTKIGRLGILGLGTVGVVVKARGGGRDYALKIRRTDANRPDMSEEVRVTRLANRIGIGPEVYSSSRDMILMKLLLSQEIREWIAALRGRGKRDEVRGVLHALLNQCRKLDIMGIDHGQLSTLRKHAVIAEGMPWIIDFESAGTGRRTRNVTTAAQYLLVGGAVAPSIRRILGVRETGTLRRDLSDYKRDPTDYSYSKILEHLRLASA